MNPIKIELGPLSIQWFEVDPGPCVVCEREVGSRPVGFNMDEPPGPLCDVCLLELNKDLGMLLLMAQVNRELALQADAASGRNDPWTADQVMVTLMMFPKVYDQGAKWPRRRIAAMEYVEALQARAAQVPVGAVINMIRGDKH